MATIYLKSGGMVECEGYTVKDNCVRAVGVKFIQTQIPQEKEKQPEAVIPLYNVLYIVK